MQLMKISIVPYMMKNYVKNRHTKERKYSGRVWERDWTWEAPEFNAEMFRVI